MVQVSVSPRIQGRKLHDYWWSRQTETETLSPDKESQQVTDDNLAEEAKRDILAPSIAQSLKWLYHTKSKFFAVCEDLGIDMTERAAFCQLMGNLAELRVSRFSNDSPTFPWLCQDILSLGISVSVKWTSEACRLRL